MSLAWLSLVALLAVIAISCMARVNPGLIAIVFTWLIAVYAGTGPNPPLGVSVLFAGFPVELFLTLFGASLLFTQAQINGTLTRLAGLVERACHGNVGWMPVVFFMAALAIGTIGPGNIAVAGLIAPVAMSAAVRAGIPPFLMAIAVGHGAIACTLSPFTAAGILTNKILADMDLRGHAWQIYAYNAAANATAAMIGYLVFGGWRLFLRKENHEPGNEKGATSAKTSAHGAEGIERIHRLTLIVMAAVVVAVVAGGVHLGLAAFAGAAAMSVFKLADERDAFRKLPWGVIVMVCGVSLLTALLDKTGGTKQFAELIHRFSTPSTVTAILAFVTGFVSVYSSTTGVVLPAFLPMVKTLTVAGSYSNPLALALAVVVGGNLVDVSPLSTIGALCVAATPDSVDRRRLFQQLLAWGFAQCLVGAVLAWLFFRAG